MPHVILLAGPNGAGKSTVAEHLLKGALRVQEFVNADTIAAGLSAFAPDSAAFHAGRVMSGRITELSKSRKSFAFESTLSAKSFAPRLKRLKARGYSVRVVFRFLSYAADITRAHGIFCDLYMPLADQWRIYDNSESKPRLVAIGRKDSLYTRHILVPKVWNEFVQMGKIDG